MTLLLRPLLLLWPLYQLTQLPLFNLGLPVSPRLYLLDLLFLILLLPTFIKILKTRSLPKESKPLARPLLFFFASIILSLLTAKLTSPQLQFKDLALASLYPLRLLLYSQLLFLTVPKSYSKVLTASFFLLVILGLAQYFFLPDTRFLQYLGYDDHYYRLLAPFLDPNFQGAALSLIFLLSLSQFKKPQTKLLLLLAIIALALTFSRISYLSFLVGLGFLGLNHRSIRKFSFSILLTLCFLIFLAPKPAGEGVNLLRTFSITSRFQNLHQGWQLFTQNPLTGVGFNTLPLLQADSTSLLPQRSIGGLDNSFLFVLATTGLVGFSAFLYLLQKLFQTLRSPYLQAAFISLLVHSLANNTLFYIPTLILFFFSWKLFNGRT